MTSKWINKDLFNTFQKEKKEEAEKPLAGTGFRRMDQIWPTPEKGTTDKPKIYEGRFLSDKNGNFHKKYFYHMFKSGEKWVFLKCPKTEKFDNFCPFCTASSKLFQGTAADKKDAYNYLRKERYVCNWYIIDDPRDSEREDEDKMNGIVKLYEFPGKVEQKLKEEITDTKNGLGWNIYDPSEDGYNFLLKVLSTKRDKNNKVWPDYSNSTFTRRSSSLGTDKEIDAIMESTHDIDAYIASMERDNDFIIKTLKDVMLWDLVKDDWKKYNEVASSEPNDIDDSIWDNTEATADKEEIEETQTDAELLEDLKALDAL